jgi:hypothetical protein
MKTAKKRKEQLAGRRKRKKPQKKGRVAQLGCTGGSNMAYLPHARKVEPQNQPFLNNTPTNNGTAGLSDPFLGYGSVNTFPRRRMTSHSKNTGRESRDSFTARLGTEKTLFRLLLYNRGSVFRCYNSCMA